MSEDYGLKISKAGQDVKTATGTNLLFTTGRRSFKTTDFVHTTVTLDTVIDPFLPANQGQRVIAHGLGFTPIAVCFYKSASGAYFGLPLLTGGGGINFTTDATNLIITAFTSEAIGTIYDIYYSISATEKAV